MLYLLKVSEVVKALKLGKKTELVQCRDQSCFEGVEILTTIEVYNPWK